ncbi:Protein N-acetyltransferase, RimJ/RimL family [Pseudomonas flavescens]|uniref:Protein N-acetyltransferase, RimJ/RimL family n=1 Tax=Phytopseudomonas flavescens TaxID=29435 RepID=A0A1G8PK47_9GAMM|nr:GNAT family protein [Pseudomonas flavescens]SDI92929.1 Protein N-acetyltransferase, RimJ/RimL family [Pseudomonas flavescens]
MLIHTERLLIRSYVAEDAPALHEAAQASINTVGRWLPWCDTNYSLAVAESWIAHCQRAQENSSAFNLGIFLRESGQLCGSVAINQVDYGAGCGKIGYWLHQDKQGYGLASEAVRAIIPFGFDELGLTRLEIVVALGNEASRRVAERVGAQREGIVPERLPLPGGIADAWVYSLDRKILHFLRQE